MPKSKTNNYENTRLVADPPWRFGYGAAGESSKARKLNKSKLEINNYFVFSLFRLPRHSLHIRGGQATAGDFVINLLFYFFSLFTFYLLLFTIYPF